MVSAADAGCLAVTDRYFYSAVAGVEMVDCAARHGATGSRRRGGGGFGVNGRVGTGRDGKQPWW